MGDGLQSDNGRDADDTLSRFRCGCSSGELSHGSGIVDCFAAAAAAVADVCVGTVFRTGVVCVKSTQRGDGACAEAGGGRGGDEGGTGGGFRVAFVTPDCALDTNASVLLDLSVDSLVEVSFFPVNSVPSAKVQKVLHRLTLLVCATRFSSQGTFRTMA